MEYNVFYNRIADRMARNIQQKYSDVVAFIRRRFDLLHSEHFEGFSPFTSHLTFTRATLILGTVTLIVDP